MVIVAHPISYLLFCAGPGGMPRELEVAVGERARAVERESAGAI
jgi:hypothetical protein